MRVRGHRMNGPRIADVDQDVQTSELRENSIALWMANHIEIERVPVVRPCLGQNEITARELLVVPCPQLPSSSDVFVQMAQFGPENLGVKLVQPRVVAVFDRVVRLLS